MGLAANVWGSCINAISCEFGWHCIDNIIQKLTRNLHKRNHHQKNAEGNRYTTMNKASIEDDGAQGRNDN